MKICFLAPANNYHTIKWCEYFTNRCYEVHVISFIDSKIDNVIVHYIDAGVNPIDKDTKKIKYLLCSKKIKKLINTINPDIVNAHHATSYGMIAALCKLDKYVLSVWGYDVYKFPNKSFFHKLYFKFLINKANYICSTSEAMAKKIKEYTKKEVHITPFGVKMGLFNSNKRNRNDNNFIIGTVKSLKEKYGIRYIIEAVSIIKNEIPNLKVIIAGVGEDEIKFKNLAKEKHVDISWLGHISQEEASIVWANMDIALIPSIDDSESFGVSVIEAEASEIPVVISDIPGLLETTTYKSRLVVNRKDSQALANAILYLYKNSKKRKKMGIEGRKYVLKKYEYNLCFNNIEKLFNKIINE